MLSGSISKMKIDSVDSLLEKGESNPDSLEFYKGLVLAQKKFIEQQKLLIDWLTGEVTNPNQPGLPSKPQGVKGFLKDRPAQLWIAGCLLALMSLASLIAYFAVDYNFGSPNPVVPTFGHDDDLGDGIQVIHRKEWLARDPLTTINIATPPKMIRILHTASENCKDYQTCANKVLGLQAWQVGIQNMPDIAYNFLIGGDGNVYIGRGADVQNEDRPDTIDIAYVGNYLAPYDKMNGKMEEAGKRLINRLLKKSKINEDYFIVPENQTEKGTTSPGQNIYMKIIQWPRYDPGLYFSDDSVANKSDSILE